MNKKLIGHNQPPLQLEDFLILDANGKSTGRIKFTNIIIRKQIRSGGEHDIEINPYHDLSAKIKITVNSIKKE